MKLRNELNELNVMFNKLGLIVALEEFIRKLKKRKPTFTTLDRLSWVENE